MNKWIEFNIVKAIKNSNKQLSCGAIRFVHIWKTDKVEITCFILIYTSCTLMVITTG